MVSGPVLSAPGVGSICLGVMGINNYGTAFSEQSSSGASNNRILGQAAPFRRRGNGGRKEALSSIMKYPFNTTMVAQKC